MILNSKHVELVQFQPKNGNNLSLLSKNIKLDIKLETPKIIYHLPHGSKLNKIF